MIDCDELALRLMDYAMDDLGDEARAQVEAHLQACPGCARLVDEYRAVSHMVHDAFTEVLSPAEQAALDEAVLAAVRRQA